MSYMKNGLIVLALLSLCSQLLPRAYRADEHENRGLIGSIIGGTTSVAVDAVETPAAALTGRKYSKSMRRKNPDKKKLKNEVNTKSKNYNARGKNK